MKLHITGNFIRKIPKELAKFNDAKFNDAKFKTTLFTDETLEKMMYNYKEHGPGITTKGNLFWTILTTF